MDQEWIRTLALLGSVFILILFVNFLTKYWDKLNEKFRSMGVKLDYQLELLSGLIVVIISFVFLFPIIGLMMHNIPALFGLLVVVCYPIGFMILRPVTFEKVLKIDSDFHIYRIFIIFSAMAGGYFIITGFSSMNFNYPLTYSLTMIFIGLLGQTVPLLPDYIEKISRFDLGMNRTEQMNDKKSGRSLLFLGTLSVITFLILQFITGIIIS